MKIIHIVDSMEMGGAEMLVTQLCRWQRRDGHAPMVHCLMEGGVLADQLEQEGIPVYVCAPFSDFSGKFRLMRDLWMEFKRQRPDVVHCHNTFATVMAAPSARWVGVGAVVTTRHGLVSPPGAFMKQNGLPGKLGNAIRFCLAAAYCDRVVAVCKKGQENLEAAPGAFLYKVSTIQNGTDPAPVGLSPDPLIGKEGFTLINVARLDWKKNHACLLRAVAQARRKVPDLYLWLLGDGPERENLQRLACKLNIQSCVQFAGQRRDVGDWLAQADLFVLSSFTEGLPVSLMEAMASGLPFIVTDVGDMPEIARSSGAGTVVESDHPEELAEAIVQAASQREELVETGRRARKYYEEHFTPSQMVASYTRLYQDCIRRNM